MYTFYLEKRTRITSTCYQQQLQSAGIGGGIKTHTLGQRQINSRWRPQKYTSL